MSDFWTYWYIHIPNFVLAAIAYTLAGRFLLGLFVPRDWDNYIWRFFRLITDPVVNVVRRITPSAVADPAVVPLAFFWIMALRFVFLATMIHLGIAPAASSGA
ncbi:YggT family protein [Mesorhizobium australicum]|uniref:YGGT family protein n=1 Tax=Mesorhizobium australicum TaxID=536018 RepID=A0A1X7PDH3_9HYPH|nr:YggT family protein [Mesorhizobium australicum]SMH49214.1 YGGT family protein [Mesorhizobium australicum]